MVVDKHQNTEYDVRNYIYRYIYNIINLSIINYGDNWKIYINSRDDINIHLPNAFISDLHKTCSINYSSASPINFKIEFIVHFSKKIL